MELKKSPKSDLKNRRFDFFLIGLALSMLFVFGAFSYRVFDPSTDGFENVIIEEDIVVMENTVQEKKPPPPPPPPEIEVVEDDEEIEEEQPEIEENEIDQDTEMADYETEEEEEEPEETNEVFEFFDVSEQATFPGGEDGLLRYLAENISYPDMALENDVQGTVMVLFVVTQRGGVENVQIMGQKKGFGLEEEAIRVVKKTSGMWKPAKQREKPVKMRYRIPVKFQIF